MERNDVPLEDKNATESTAFDALAKSTESTSENPTSDDEQSHQSIFDERFNAYMEDFGKKCHDNAVIAIAMVIDPNVKTPLIYYKGDIYNVAKFMAEVLRDLKHEIIRTLET